MKCWDLIPWIEGWASWERIGYLCIDAVIALTVFCAYAIWKWGEDVSDPFVRDAMLLNAIFMLGFIVASVGFAIENCRKEAQESLSKDLF